MRVQPHTLPDGGRKIRLQIEELEQALKALRLGKDETKNIAPGRLVIVFIFMLDTLRLKRVTCVDQ